MQNLNPYLSPILDALDHCLSENPICNEHQLIKHLQNHKIPPFDHFSLDQSKDLFSAHFLCMHGLYHLKNTYQQEKTFNLIIQSVHVERRVCEEELTECEKRATVLETIDPLERYYLNATHYFETQEQEINDLLKSFWQKYLAQDHRKEALEVLNLPEDADATMIKTQYRRLAQKHHPDKGGNAEMFNKIRQAKAILET